ncbi:MAG TPA: glycosyl hydrolase [Candidatus Acidoferrales bacterium]|nr:glycosyl hydrolase [Candidatus Acidoferrales bacterium]
MIFRNKLRNTTTGPPTPPESPRRRAWRLPTIAAAIAAGGLALTGIFAGIAQASTKSPANLSGLPWNSGVYVPVATPAAANAFGAWRGHPVDVATLWPARSTWNDFIDPTWLYQRWQGAPQTLALGEPMIPEGVSGVSLAACAAGNYNSYWKQFGTNISAYGLGNSIIRLGWEFNGNWYIWAATNPTTWVQCWRQIVTSARSTAPGLQWDWNVSRGVSPGLTDPTQAYPGDAYVDTIGVDSYDMWPPANASGGWNTQLNGTQGLNYWLNFAQAHGKKLAIPEWGNMTIGTNVGHDDPAYVNDMLGFFKANASSLAWESNFQGTTSGGMYGPGSPVPNASAAYQAGF